MNNDNYFMPFLKRNRQVNIDLIIDDIFKIIPTKELFKIEPLLIKVLEEKKMYNKNDIYNVVGIDTIEKILLTADLVENKTGSDFTLTEKGILAKEIGGLTLYRKYRQQQIGFNSYQRNVNSFLIVATILSAISPIIVEIISIDKSKIVDKVNIKQVNIETVNCRKRQSKKLINVKPFITKKINKKNKR